MLLQQNKYRVAVLKADISGTMQKGKIYPVFDRKLHHASRNQNGKINATNNDLPALKGIVMPPKIIESAEQVRQYAPYLKYDSVEIEQNFEDEDTNEREREGGIGFDWTRLFNFSGKARKNNKTKIKKGTKIKVVLKNNN